MQPLSYSPDAANRLMETLAFDKSALLPAIAMQHDTYELLMQAWMNREALLETLTTGRVCYYSRSRQGLWRKGDTSGHIQTLVGFRVDCDRDSLLLLVNQTGAACHTNRRNCYFYEAQADGTFVILSSPLHQTNK
jgi:phosphoribosyl-AMP cyclohydrolase